MAENELPDFLTVSSCVGDEMMLIYDLVGDYVRRFTSYASKDPGV